MRPYCERGGIVIFNARAEDVLPALTETPALVLADPPYGVNEKTSRLTRKGAKDRLHPGSVRGREWVPVAGDATPFDPTPYLTYPKVILWGANHYADRLPTAAGWLVWDKRDGTTPDDNADCELAWTNLRGPARLYAHLWRGVCRASEAGQTPLHPTQKPVALMRWCIQRAGIPAGSLILDPYMGSGPVLRAALDLGYRAVGIEVNEGYCEAAANRLAQGVLPLEVTA